MVQFLSKEDLQKLRFKNQRANEQVRIATDKRIDAIKNNKQTISDNPRHDLYNDLFTDGNIINYPHGRVMMFGQKPYFWRGQIKDYGTCTSSLTRHLNSEKSSDPKIEIFV